MNLETSIIFSIILVVILFIGRQLSIGLAKKFHIPPEGIFVRIEGVFDDGSFVASFLGKRKYYRGGDYYEGSMGEKYPFYPTIGDYRVITVSERFTPGVLRYWKEMRKI